VLGGSFGDAIERKVEENQRIEEMKRWGGSCGRPPAEKMVIHLSAFCLIRLHSILGLLGRKRKTKRKKESREI
jgi:hypothetical protein